MSSSGEKESVFSVQRVFIITVGLKGACFISLKFNQHIPQFYTCVSSASFTQVIYSLDIVIAIDTAFSKRSFGIYVLENPNQPLDNHLLFLDLEPSCS